MLREGLDRRMRPAAPALAALLLLAFALPGAEATPVTRSCELVPHGFLIGLNTNGCSVYEQATQSVHAVVYVTAGTIDAIEIEMKGPGLVRHVFVCTFAVSVSSCVLPVQQSNVNGLWTVTARIVAADPLGPFFFGGADTHARLDATFT